MAERIQELEQAAVDYRQAVEWSDMCQENVKHLEAELEAARVRKNLANHKMYEAHTVLVDASLKM